MDRRTFIAGWGVALAATPLVGQAQQAGKVWRIGVLTVHPRPAPATPHHYHAFLDGLRDLGYVEGQNIVIEWRYGQGQQDRRIREATGLAGWKPDVIMASSGADALVLREVAKDVPIVIAGGGDLVGMGLAGSLARPGGNVTGVQILSPEVTTKHLELMKEVVPRLRRVGFLYMPGTSGDVNRHFDSIYADLAQSARKVAIDVIRVVLPSIDDLDGTLAELRGKDVQGIIVPANALAANAPRVGELTLRHRIPSVYEVRNHVESGGLISYGYDLEAVYRLATRYVDRILKGAKAADLPIEQPTKFELVINLKTAKVLGLTIPQSLLARADRMIQ